jgi:hypothetical protein
MMLISNSHDIAAPILMFDRDDYVYAFDTVPAALSWLEPATLEELDGIFDGRGSPVLLVIEPLSLELSSDMSNGISQRVQAAHVRGNLMEFDPSDSVQSLIDRLAQRFKIKIRHSQS